MNADAWEEAFSEIPAECVVTREFVGNLMSAEPVGVQELIGAVVPVLLSLETRIVALEGGCDGLG